MKRLLRITVLFSVTLLWWGEKGYAATPAMDAAEKETVSATVEAEADKKDPKSDKKSDEPKRKRNLAHGKTLPACFPSTSRCCRAR